MIRLKPDFLTEASDAENVPFAAMNGIEGLSLAEKKCVLEALLDLISLSPCRELKRFIGGGVQVGPVRRISTTSIPSRRNSNWYDGSRAWAELVPDEVDESPFEWGYGGNGGTNK